MKIENLGGTLPLRTVASNSKLHTSNPKYGIIINMKLGVKRVFCFLIIAAFISAVSFVIAEYSVSLPISNAHIEDVAKLNHFPEGELVFRAQNKQSGTVFSNYETKMLPSMALQQVKLSLVASGYEEVFSTESLMIFEDALGRYAAVQAYLNERYITVVSILQK